MGKMVCKTCGKLKDKSAFRMKQRVKLKSGIKEYISCHCIVCDNAHKLRYQQNNPHSWISYKYKISKEEARYWFERSLGSCEICGVKWKEGKEKLCIDHDHNTNKIRGVLCKHCNTLLGHAKESLSILENAKSYLISHREN